MFFVWHNKWLFDPATCKKMVGDSAEEVAIEYAKQLKKPVTVAVKKAGSEKVERIVIQAKLHTVP